MGKSKEAVITIQFDGDFNNTFYIVDTAQNVTGHVHVRTSKRIQIKGIRLEVTGKADTSWTEGSSDDETSYYGTEVYLTLDMCLISSPSEDIEMYLEPSDSGCQFPFSFILSADLPRSFESRYGRIQYKAKVVIDRLKKKKNIEAEVTFEVIRLLDLNLQPPRLREPQVMNSETTASGCFCDQGFTEINATVSRGCFVAGETILIDGEIVNRTNTDIKYSTILIFQCIEYWSTYKDEKVYSTRSYTKLAEFKRPLLRRGHTDCWNNISFVVPPGLSAELDGCGIMRNMYFVEVSSTFRGCCRENNKASCEIVIGDIPLRADYFQPSVVTTQPLGLPMPSDMSVGYMGLPPTNVPTLGYDNPVVQFWNKDGKDEIEDLAL